MPDKRRNTLADDGSSVQIGMIDIGDGLHAERVAAYPPEQLLTGGDSQNTRLSVEVGQTSFFEGREFRSFVEFSIPAGTARYFKASVPIDIILQGLGMQIDDGYVKMESFVNVADPTGFTTELPVFGANRMNRRPQPYYTNQVEFFGDGTFSGGVILDILTVKTANNSAQASTQDAAVAGDRGLAPGDYYIKLTNLGTGTAVGIMKARWEECA